MKRIVLLTLVAALLLGLGAEALATYTMSWGFQMINNPNARQVALNIANAQEELNRVAEDQSGLDRFKESLDRMVMSKAIRDIVYYEPDREAFYGFIPVDDGWIYYEWDEVGQAMKIYYYANGSWTEISIDTGSQPQPPSF